MRKIALILIVFLIVINGCQKISETKKEEPAPALPSKTSLPDLETTACNTADEAGTCDTRLNELGIVLKEDCCRILGKCC